jgi:hypothetical protein
MTITGSPVVDWNPFIMKPLRASTAAPMLGKNASRSERRHDTELGMLLCNETHRVRRMLAGTLLYCLVLPAIGADNTQVVPDVETTPFPPYPAAAMKAHQQGEIRLRITLEKGRVIDVTTVSGPPTLALPTARWIKACWKLRPDISGVYDLVTGFSFNNPNVDAAALIRIIVKDGRIIEVAPVDGSPKAAAAAVDLVKKKWEFSPKQSLIVLLPVKVR